MTAHHRVSRALRDANERMTLLLDSAPYSVLTVQPDFTISYVNRTPPGWPSQTLGRSLPALMHPDARRRLAECLRALFTDGSPFTLEAQDAEGTWLEACATALRTRGEVQGALIFMVDVTERRTAAQARARLGEQLQHAQKLESLGVLAGGVAHDFNNLLAGVLGNIELVRHHVPAASPGHKHLDDIFTASRRAADLAGQMLAYSGKGQFVIEAIDIAALVRDMAGLLEVSKSKSVALQFEFETDIPAFEGDTTQIRQIAMNLITNAADSIDGSGRIMLAAGVEDFSAADLAENYVDEALQTGRFVWLEVTDTGCGMDAATQRRMFEPFFTTKSVGRGLGLAAVLGIVRGHSGALRVISEPGRGTTVRCMFPASTAAPASRCNTLPRCGARPRSGLVLVVDDEALVRTVLTQLLQRAGFDVLVGADGSEGVALFREHHRELAFVLLDVTMPGMDGRVVLREMLKIDPGAKAILMRGYNEHVVTQDLGRELAGFLHKPFAPAELLELIDTVLDPRRVRSV